jgi:hypothetical protein
VNIRARSGREPKTDCPWRQRPSSAAAGPIRPARQRRSPFRACAEVGPTVLTRGHRRPQSVKLTDYIPRRTELVLDARELRLLPGPSAGEWTWFDPKKQADPGRSRLSS